MGTCTAFRALEGVVPDLSDVDVNLMWTRISLIFWSHLYAITGRNWKMSAVSSSSLRRLTFLNNMSLICWLSGGR